MITSPDITEKVHAFEEPRQIAVIDTDEVGEADLFNSVPFSCYTNVKSVITTIWHPQEQQTTFNLLIIHCYSRKGTLSELFSVIIAVRNKDIHGSALCSEPEVCHVVSLYAECSVFTTCYVQDGIRIHACEDVAILSTST